MRRALWLVGGSVLGLMAVGLLWGGPVLYADEAERWYAAASTRLAVLGAIVGLIAQGAVAAAGAAWCLARVWQSLSGPPAAVRPGLLLPIGGLFFLLGTIGPAQLAYDEWQNLHDIGVAGVHFSREILDSMHQRVRIGCTFTALYVWFGGALLVAPWLLKSKGWPWRQRLNGVGCGLVVFAFLLSALAVLVDFGNRLTGEGYREGVTLLASYVILWGTGLAVTGGVVAAVGWPFRAGGRP